MSNFSTATTVDVVLNVVSAVTDIVAMLVCIIMLCAVIYHIITIKYHRGQVKIDVSLILSINILCSIFTKSSIQIIHVTVPTLMKDFHLMIEFEETSFLRVRAYILWSMIGVLYWSYVLLAFFRFIRVMHPTHLWINRSFLYLYVFIPGQFICIFIGMLPLLLIFDAIHLIPNEAYCSILSIPFLPFTYSGMIIFVAPYTILCIFYLGITRKMRQSSVIRPYQERNRRDFIVIRRMLLNMVILFIVAIPCGVLYFYGQIRNNPYPITYRVQWLSSSFSSCLFQRCFH